jgi:hypothetical protein
MFGIDQANLKALLLQHLEKRNPINPGRFHSDALDLACLEPLAQGDQIAGKDREIAHGPLIPILRHSHPMGIGSHIDSGGVEMHLVQNGPFSAALVFSFL